MKKARIFNIMQYMNHPESGAPLLSRETIEAVVAKKGIKRYAYVLHDKDVYSARDEEDDPDHVQGTVKPPHWHIVLQAGYQVEIGVIAKWLGIADNFVDVPKGSGPGKFIDCVEYLTHERAEQQEIGKHRYADDEIKSNFDFRSVIGKRNDNKIKYGRDLDDKDQMRYDVLYGGKTLRQCMAEDRLAYMNDIDRLQKLRLEYIANAAPPKTRLNYYVCGQGGIGKGLISRALARSMYPDLTDDEDIFFEVGARGALYEGYDGQPVIIYNDRRAADLLAELGGRGNVFDVFDTHPTKGRQNVKYASICLCNSVNIVNSVQGYVEFLDALCGEYTDSHGEEHHAEDKGQSYRRFPFILPLHKEDFDLLLNAGFLNGDDRYEEYVEHRHLRGNMQRIHEVCAAREDLLREIEAKTVAPVVAEHRRLLAQVSAADLDEAEIRAMFADYGSPVKDVILSDCDETVPDDVPWENAYEERVKNCEQVVLPGCGEREK